MADRKKKRPSSILDTLIVRNQMKLREEKVLNLYSVQRKLRGIENVYQNIRERDAIPEK